MSEHDWRGGLHSGHLRPVPHGGGTHFTMKNMMCCGGRATVAFVPRRQTAGVGWDHGKINRCSWTNACSQDTGIDECMQEFASYCVCILFWLIVPTFCDMSAVCSFVLCVPLFLCELAFVHYACATVLCSVCD